MAADAKPRTVVSERALFRRVDRLLHREIGTRLHRCPWGSRGIEQLGRYYTTDERTGFIVARGIQLERDAREIGVLRDDEMLEERR